MFYIEAIAMRTNGKKDWSAFSGRAKRYHLFKAARKRTQFAFMTTTKSELSPRALPSHPYIRNTFKQITKEFQKVF